MNPFQQTAERQDQVAELLRNLPAAESLNRDQTLFQVPLTLPDGTATHVRVSLPPSFPAAPPALSLGARVAHTWVDGAGRLTTPELASWSPPASRLATAVGEAVAALSSPGGGPPPRTDQPPPLPPPPSTFPELDAASDAQLEAWVTDPAAYGELAAKVAARVAKERGGAPAAVPSASTALDTAKATLAKEATLAELRNQVAVIRSSEYTDAAEAAASAAARQRAVADAIAPAALVAGLAAASADADAASGRAYDAFLAGGAAKVDAFLKEYVSMRTDVHRLELKKEAAKATLL